MSLQTHHKQFQLTPEQIALAEHRKAKRQQIFKNSNQSQETQKNHSTLIAHRTWLPVHPLPTKQRGEIIKVLTWNLLAQCLIRRELFPTSNCLRAAQREQMTHQEILNIDADIMCLQEVDRLEKLLPVLDKAGYAYHYAAGPKKKHGCLIAFKKDLFSMGDSKIVEYDIQEVRSDGDENSRRGRSFNTRNIASLVLLQSKTKKGNGVLMATTHLFWHPKYTYERARQTAILFREILKFRNEAKCESWPCVVGGDFNFAPDDPVYSLIAGDPLSPEQETRLTTSQVIHVSVDPTIVASTEIVNADEADGEELDPDKIITNARPANRADGLLSLTELVEMFAKLPQIESVYDKGIGQIDLANGPRTFGHRVPISPTRRGRNEPEYTSYTHFWKAVLDYIFVLNPADRHLRVAGLLASPKTEDFKSGLPQKDVCGSDHISLAARLCWDGDDSTPLLR